MKVTGFLRISFRSGNLPSPFEDHAGKPYLDKVFKRPLRGYLSGLSKFPGGFARYLTYLFAGGSCDRKRGGNNRDYDDVGVPHFSANSGPAQLGIDG